MSINCCHRADCADHNCPGRGVEPTEFHWEGVLERFGWFLCGIGFLAALIAGLCFFWRMGMNLPPLPLDPVGKEWTDDEAKIIQAYALLAIKTVCGGKHPKKFGAEEVREIRIAHATGHGYKQVNKHHPMSEKTFYNIVNKQGAYK